MRIGERGSTFVDLMGAVELESLAEGEELVVEVEVGLGANVVFVVDLEKVVELEGGFHLVSDQEELLVPPDLILQLGFQGWE